MFSLPRNGLEPNSESLLLAEFRVVFSSAKGFGTEFREYAFIFVPRNGIPSCILFRGRVRNGIPEFSVPRNSRNSVGNKHLFRLFRLPRNYFFVGNSQPYPCRRREIDIIESRAKTMQDHGKEFLRSWPWSWRRLVVSNFSHKGMGSRRIPIKQSAAYKRAQSLDTGLSAI